MEKQITTFGVIVGARAFFNSELALGGRKEILELLSSRGYGSIILDTNTTPTGIVEGYEDAKKCEYAPADTKE